MNRVRTDFFPTPTMSSYLVALVVSDFVCINGTANAGLTGNLPIKSCGRSTASNQLSFGLDVGIRSIEVLQNTLNVQYPLPKEGSILHIDSVKYISHYLLEDHIAIPDFAAGAMENWGLVTYRFVLSA